MAVPKAALLIYLKQAALYDKQIIHDSGLCSSWRIYAKQLLHISQE